MVKFNKLLFGTAGIPLTAPKRNLIDGLDYLKDINLDNLELEFVRNINVSKEKAEIVNKKVRKKNIILSAHGSYYINLNAIESEKIKASKKRIIDGATRAYESGAFSFVFHAGYYLKQNSDIVYNNIKKQIKDIIKELKENNINIWIRPETTGKATQFGSLNELIRLSSEVDNVMPCIDFSHLHARSNGKYNSYDETYKILEDMENNLGKKSLKEMHIHMSGIEYNEKGERYHLELDDSDFKYKEILKAWKDFNIKGVVVSESPNIEKDALKMKKYYYNLN